MNHDLGKTQFDIESFRGGLALLGAEASDADTGYIAARQLKRPEPS